MTISATNGYLNASHHLLDQARSEFDSGDLRQASEKGWGAAAQIVKAVAEQRGWEHSTHRLLFKIVNDLAEETGDNELVGEFGFAHNLHVNFYKNGSLPSSLACIWTTSSISFAVSNPSQNPNPTPPR